MRNKNKKTKIIFLEFSKKNTNYKNTEKQAKKSIAKEKKRNTKKMEQQNAHTQKKTKNSKKQGSCEANKKANKNKIQMKKKIKIQRICFYICFLLVLKEPFTATKHKNKNKKDLFYVFFLILFHD